MCEIWYSNQANFWEIPTENQNHIQNLGRKVDDKIISRAQIRPDRTIAFAIKTSSLKKCIFKSLLYLKEKKKNKEKKRKSSLLNFLS